jgi:hypothetical protein
MAEFKPITEQDFAARTLKSKGRPAVVVASARYDSEARGVTIWLTNGVAATFPLGLLPGLERATEADLSEIVVEARGYGLHVPALDADISAPQLFADHLGSSMMLKALRRGQASKANGRLGGRPKKKDAEAA